MGHRHVRVVVDRLHLVRPGPQGLVSDEHVPVDDPWDHEPPSFHADGTWGLPPRILHPGPVEFRQRLVGLHVLVHRHQIRRLFPDPLWGGPLQVVRDVVQELVDQFPLICGNVVHGVPFGIQTLQHVPDALYGIQPCRVPDPAGIRPGLVEQDRHLPVAARGAREDRPPSDEPCQMRDPILDRGVSLGASPAALVAAYRHRNDLAVHLRPDHADPEPVGRAASGDFLVV